MKFFLFIALLIAFIAIGCQNNNQQKNTSASSQYSTTAAPADKSASLKTERERLIEALQKLQHDIASKDKEVIAGYYRFPVQSDDLQAFDIGDVYDKAVQRNHYQVSRELFTTNFTALYSNLEMQGLTDMFAHVPLAKLQDTTTKQIEARKAEDVCMHYYSITLVGKEVTLQYGVNTDEDYVKKYPDKEPECAEYAAFWTFTFDGEKLVFNRHQVAG